MNLKEKPHKFVLELESDFDVSLQEHESPGKIVAVSISKGPLNAFWFSLPIVDVEGMGKYREYEGKSFASYSIYKVPDLSLASR